MPTSVTITDDNDDDDDDVPANDLSLSIRARIEELDVGASFARARCFDFDRVTKDAMHKALRRMRLSTQATVHRIKLRTGYAYIIEEGEIRTASRDIILVLVITRMS